MRPKKLRFESKTVAKILAYEEEKLRNLHDLKRPLCDANVFAIYTHMYMGIYKLSRRQGGICAAASMVKMGLKQRLSILNIQGTCI